MPISRELQTELEKRDELILALEMLAVDQASRLLAIEAIVVNLVGERSTIRHSVKEWIEREFRPVPRPIRKRLRLHGTRTTDSQRSDKRVSPR